jgi:hypothetical protein
MDRGHEQFSRHAQVTGEEAGEVEGAQIGFRHGEGSREKDRHPCACDRCSNLAVAVIVTRSGVMAACPICSEIAFSQAAQPLSLERFYEGEREHETTAAVA